MLPTHGQVPHPAPRIVLVHSFVFTEVHGKPNRFLYIATLRNCCELSPIVRNSRAL